MARAGPQAEILVVAQTELGFAQKDILAFVESQSADETAVLAEKDCVDIFAKK